MTYAKRWYKIIAVPEGEEIVCDGCGMVMCGLGHPLGTAREGKSDVYYFKVKTTETLEVIAVLHYCEECYLKAVGEIPLDGVGPQEVEDGVR